MKKARAKGQGILEGNETATAQFSPRSTGLTQILKETVWSDLHSLFKVKSGNQRAKNETKMKKNEDSKKIEKEGAGSKQLL